MAEKLLILDLDETLVYAAERPLSHPADWVVGPYHVYVRPRARQFLEFCKGHFLVAVWTSSNESYATAIVTALFGSEYPLEFVWARKRCTQVFNPELQSHEWVKDLTKVRRKGYRLEEVLVVDDTARKLSRSYGNLVRVVPYLGGADDHELEMLMHYLLELKDAPNVRAIEKRGWRQKGA